jgi:hypothetical protein
MINRHPGSIQTAAVPPCRFCGKQLKSKDILYNHERRVHDKSFKPGPCPLCGQAFCSPFSLKRHLATVHRKDNKNQAGLQLKVGGKAGKEQKEEQGDDSESENYLYS